DYAYKSRDNNYPSEEDRYEAPLASAESFQEYLLSQLGFLPLSAGEKQIGEVIIGNIDENGYLQRTPEAIANDLAFYGGLDISAAEVEKVLSDVQSLDPPGVAARNLQECLKIQLKQKERENEADETKAEDARSAEAALLALALRLTDRYFDDFLKRRYEHLAEKLHIDEGRLQEVLQLISSLNPKPGAAWSGHESEKHNPGIIPDFYLFYDDEHFVLTLHSTNEPVLKVSEAYNRMLRTYKDDRQSRAKAEAAQFVKEKIDAARWFIDMVHQRQQTLLTIGNCLVNFQKDYFSSGDPHRLKPMRLKDIAAQPGYDISTASRVTAQKYMQTPYGIIALKTLFSQGIQNEEGTEISTARIKEALKTLIDAEDKTAPLSDDVLVEELKKQGLSVARRTIAKYRQQLGIPVARMRRTL
ncbi:MAG: RNA polymerase factor sigma-54, partial [Bacteroidales bacterium]|nr:RNA polymerase factor sigma-54 [Bacteroidales bacterium]